MTLGDSADAAPTLTSRHSLSLGAHIFPKSSTLPSGSSATAAAFIDGVASSATDAASALAAATSARPLDMVDPSYAASNITSSGDSTLGVNASDFVNVAAAATDAGADPVYLSSAYVSLAFVLFATLIVAGLCGNVLIVVIVTRMRKMKTPTNCYLVSLAAADCLVLISAPLPALPELFYASGNWIYGPVLCSLLVFFQYVAANASSLTIGAFTLERYISICHPMRAQTLSRYARASKIVAGIWTFSALYCSPWLYLATVRAVQVDGGWTLSTCTFRLTRELYRTVYMVDLLLFYCAPLACTCVLYALIARTLFRRTGSFEKRPNSDDGNSGGGDGVGRALLRTSSSLSPARPKFVKQTSRLSNGSAQCGLEERRAQVVKMLVVVTVLFAVLWMPYRVWVVYNSFAPEGKFFSNMWFSLFAKTLAYINSAINPLLYSAFSKKFREAFVHYLTCQYLCRRRSLGGRGCNCRLHRRSTVNQFLSGASTCHTTASRRTSNTSA